MIHTTFPDDESILEYVITTTSDGMEFKCPFYTKSGKYMGKISNFYYKDIDGKYPSKDSEQCPLISSLGLRSLLTLPISLVFLFLN